jgi:hypothetical protein
VCKRGPLNLSRVQLASYGVAALCLCCTPRVTPYREAREACGLEPGEYHAGTFTSHDWRQSGMVRTLDKDCTSLIADELGLRWTDFGESPSALNHPPRTVIDALLSGVYTLLSADFGIVQDVLDDESLAPWMQDRFSEHARRYDLGPSSPAGALLYIEVVSTIRRVRVDNSGYGVWSMSQGTLTVSPRDSNAVQEDGISGYYPTSARSMGLLMHESAHDVKVHVSCPTGLPYDNQWLDDNTEYSGDGCDRNFHGAYGMEMWATALWIQGLDQEDYGEADACHTANTRLQMCDAIISLSKQDWPCIPHDICGMDADDPDVARIFGQRYSGN